MGDEKSFQYYVVTFLVVGLFITALAIFGFRLGSEYGVSQADMGGDEGFDYVSLESYVNETSDDAEGWAEAFTSDNLFVTTGALVLFSIWGVVKLVFGSVILLFTVIFDGVTAVLGVPAMVTNVLFAILLISLIFAGWRTIKSGG